MKEFYLRVENMVPTYERQIFAETDNCVRKIFTYHKVGLLSACAYNFRRKLFVNFILSVRRIRLINNYGECNTESLHCNRVVNSLYRSPHQYEKIFDSIFR